MLCTMTPRTEALLAGVGFLWRGLGTGAVSLGTFSLEPHGGIDIYHLDTIKQLPLL